MLERVIESKFCRYAARLWCMVLKFTSPGRRGVPDRIVLLPKGRVIFIEFKAPGKKPSKIQSRMFDKMRALGHTVLVIDKSGDAEAALDEAIAKINREE